MQPVLPYPAQTWASGLLLHWELWLDTYSVGFFFFFPLAVMFPSEIPKLPTDPLVSCCLETSPLSRLPPHAGSRSLTLLSLYLLYFVLPPFKENRLPFWVPGVLHQRSEVVLWKLLSIQVIFWWICGGERGLPILFLCHLGTAPSQGLLWTLPSLPVS